MTSNSIRAVLIVQLLIGFLIPELLWAMEAFSSSIENKQVKIKFTIPDADMLARFEEWIIKNGYPKTPEKKHSVYFIGPKTQSVHNQKLGSHEAVVALRFKRVGKETSTQVYYPHQDPKSDSMFIPPKSLQRLIKHIQQTEQNATNEELLHVTDQLGFYKAIKLTKEQKPYLLPMSLVNPSSPASFYEVVFDKVYIDAIAKEFIEIKLRDLNSSKCLADAERNIYQLLNKVGIRVIDVHDHAYLHMAVDPNIDFSTRLDTLTGKNIESHLT